MPTIDCHTCGFHQSERIPAKFAGKSIKCPQCRRPVTVQADASLEPIDFPLHEDNPQIRTTPNVFRPTMAPPNLPDRVALEPARTIRPRQSWFARYVAWSGTRSFIFQSLLLGWTAFMFLVGVGLMFSSAASSKDAINSPFESERIGAAGAFMFMGLCCPLGSYFLLAIPLGIAAIATLEPRRNNQ